MAQEREWSHYQQAVFRAVEETGDHLIVEAVAGGAKSTTIVEATRRFVGRYKAKVVFLAFNKHIAAELKGKLGSGVQARTMHSLGYSMLRRDLPQEPEVDEDKVQKILEEIIPLPPKEKQRHDPGLKARAAMLRSIHNAVARLVSMMKNVLAKPDLDGVAYVHEHYNLELDVPEGLHLDPAQTAGNKFDHLPQFQRDAALRQLAWWEYLAPKCREVMDRCLNPDSLGTIDYDDMIWLPVMLREVVFPKFDLVAVDECQDMNLCQHRFIERLVRRGARMVLVGDSNQSIYAWRGARTDSMARLKTKLVATQLPLSVSYRCPLKHVALAKQFVPHIEPAPNAIPGRLEARWLEDILRESHTGDLIISRANAPLIGAAYQLIRMGKKAMVRGREIGVGIRTLLEQLKATDIYDLQQKIDKWEIRESRPLMDDPKGLARVHDKAETLRVLSTKADNVAGVFKAIDEIFSDKISGICCSSVHRAKGLESDRVVILQPWRMPMVRERMKAWEYQEEINVLYVAITRSKHDLVLEINEASSSGFLPSWLLPGMLDMNDVDGSTDGGSPIVRRRREQEREVSEFQNSPDAMIARLREQAASQSPQPNSGAELYSEAGAPEVDRLLATAPDNDDPEAPHRA